MSLIAKKMLQAAAGGASPYWVGTYSSSGANILNYVDSVYSDDFDLLVFSQLVTDRYEYFIVDGLIGDFVRSELQYYENTVNNYAEPSDIHLTKTTNGEVWVGTKSTGATSSVCEFVRLGASAVIDRYAIKSQVTTCMFGLADKNKNFYIFGHDGNGASFAPTINTTLERGLFSSFTQGQMNSAAYDPDQNKLYCFFSQNSSGPIIVQLDVASNADLTNASGSRITNFTTGQNPALKLRNGPSGSLYYAFYSGSSTWNVARVSKTHPFNKIDGTSVVTGFTTTNPAGATTSSNQYARMHYDSANDRVYISRDFAVCCLSSDLNSVYWVIETNLSAISATSTASGDVLLSGADYANNINVVARIDAEASQVSSTLTSPISGFSWKRSSGSITTTTSFTNQSTSTIMSTSSTGGVKAFELPASADARSYTDNVLTL